MKDKIEVGEYIKTETGFIRRIKSVDKTEETEKCPVNMYWCNLDKPIKILKECSKDTIYAIEMSDAKKLKHSNNILDLIEVGDYVNGREVKHIAMFEGFPDYPKLIFVDETHLIPDDTCENDEIQTILTKESYMANCYKVGGEKDEASND